MDEDSIKYLGCVGVKTSMRSLNHTERSVVAKESINRLCKANDIVRKPESKPCHDFINRMLDDDPNLVHSGTDVQLSITDTHLSVIAKETKQIIVQHEMPNVSFASNGDDETVDFVAYVAKDLKYGRACFVVHCSVPTGKEMLNKIARGFHLRQIILYNSNTMPHKNSNIGQDRSNTLANLFHSTDFRDTSLDASHKNNNENNRDNDALIASTRNSLEKEPWYHGSYLSREESETRLKQDGDFLVRESMLDPGHFVLSVMYDGNKTHLLFDSVGQVKTKEMVFDDISHLIKYHHDHGTPIVSDDCIVYLRNGVRPLTRIKPNAQK